MEGDMDVVGIVNYNSSDKAEKKKIRLGFFEVDLFLANIVFAFLAVVGQVGQNVSLPLWVDSTIHAARNHSKSSGDLLARNKSFFENGTSYTPRVDGYFVYSFACVAFVIIFGVALLFIRIFQPGRLGETERRFPHLQLFLIGLCDALNGVLVVFASSGKRTPPYLQAILGNFLIPMVIGFRFLILRKVPTFRKFICALVVLVSLFVCLIPKIFTEIDPDSHDSGGGQSGPGSFLWPLCFMFGFMPAAIMNVLEEKGLKMELTVLRSRVNVVFFLFWTSLYQFLTALCLFWADILPGFGYADNIHHFWDNWSFGFKCFFGGAGCTSTSGIRGTMFISMYTLSYIGGANLMRFSEGATLLAVVTALVTPLGFVFWTLFREIPFGWHPAGHITTWFSIGGLVLMVPASFFYNTGEEERVVDVSGKPDERQPLIPEENGKVLRYS